MGRPPVKDEKKKNHRICFYTDRAVAKEIRRLAFETDRSVSDYLNMLCTEHIMAIAEEETTLLEPDV